MLAQKSLLSNFASAQLITDAIAQKIPFSFLRLGDGEGALLDYSAHASSKDINYLKKHFGQSANHQRIVFFQRNLQQAIDQCDLLGVRDDAFYADKSAKLDPSSKTFVKDFRQAFPLRDAEKRTLGLHDAKRIFGLHKWVTRSQSHPNWIACSQWVHFQLQKNAFWRDLLESQSQIGLINCSEQLAERLSRRFSLEVDFIKVPDKAILQLNAIRTSKHEITHADVYDEISRKIPTNLNGKIYFIAAGLVGKNYGKIVKDNGGISLDVGALTDAWDGRATRGLVYQSVFPLTHSRFAPPPETQLCPSHAPAAAALVRHGRGERAQQLFVHLGFSKTGTTALQEIMRQSFEDLAAAGLVYLKAGRDEGKARNHHDLARSLGMGPITYADPPPRCDLKKAHRILQDMSYEMSISSAQRFLVSSEILSNITPRRESEDLLLDFFRQHQARLIFTVREQFDWLLSWYGQAARQNRMGLLLQEFLVDPLVLPNAEVFDANFFRKISKFEAWVGRGNIEILDYRTSQNGNSHSETFLHHIGVPQDAMPQPQWLNQSTKVEDLFPKIWSRRCQDVKEGRAHASVNFDERTFKDAFLRGFDPKEKARLRKIVRQRFAASNHALNAAYGCHLPT